MKTTTSVTYRPNDGVAHGSFVNGLQYGNDMGHWFESQCTVSGQLPQKCQKLQNHNKDGSAGRRRDYVPGDVCFSKSLLCDAVHTTERETGGRVSAIGR